MTVTADETTTPVVKPFYKLRKMMVDEIPRNKFVLMNIERQFQASTTRNTTPDEALRDWFSEVLAPPVEPYRFPSIELTTSVPGFIVECVQSYFKSMDRGDNCYTGQIDYKELRIWLYGEHAAISDDEVTFVFSMYQWDDELIDLARGFGLSGRFEWQS